MTVTETDTATENSANVVFDSVEGGARPAPESDLFTFNQLTRNITRNKIDLSDDSIRAFLEDMHADGWTMYEKPVEKKTTTRVLREYAKRHAEYFIEDLEGQEKEARGADRAERIRKARQELEESEAREKAEAEEKSAGNMKREQSANRKSRKGRRGF